MKKIVVILLISLIATTPAFAFAQGQEEGYFVVLDALLARPVGLVSIVLGASIFVVASPFALISGSGNKAAKVLIADPIDYTFKRPLGDFDYKIDNYKD